MTFANLTWVHLLLLTLAYWGLLALLARFRAGRRGAASEPPPVVPISDDVVVVEHEEVILDVPRSVAALGPPLALWLLWLLLT